MSALERYIPLSRKEAKALGAGTFCTGRPCKRGSIADRRVSNGQCLCEDCRKLAAEMISVCAKKNTKKKREYDQARYQEEKVLVCERVRAYRAANIINVEARELRYREGNRQKIAARMRAYAKENIATILIRGREYCKNNAALVADRRRRYYARNIDIIRIKNRLRMQSRMHEYLARNAALRASRLQRMPSWYGEFDRFVMVEAAHLARLRTETTGVAWHVDHLVPLRCKVACGLHCGWNVQVIPAYLNLQKGNKLWLCEPDQWITALTAERV